MWIYEHTKEFAGLPVVDWDPRHPIADAAHVAQRLSLDDGTSVGGAGCLPGGSLLTKLLRRSESPSPPPEATFEQFLSDPLSAQVPAIVITRWEGGDFFGVPPDRLVEQMAAARNRLRSLKAIFLADLTCEENEISWIVQGDLAPLLAAYPDLEYLKIRGGIGLRLGRLALKRLRSLVVEDATMPAAAVCEVAAAELPELEDLELWLGSEAAGDRATIADLAPILAGEGFPKLRRLALRNYDAADELAKAIAKSPLVRRLETLDLSLGTLGDEGAEALIVGGSLNSLKRLDIHLHYCTSGMVRWLKSLPIEVLADYPPEVVRRAIMEESPKRYVAVTE